MPQAKAGVVAEHDGILLTSDKGLASTPFAQQPADQGIELCPTSRQKEKARHGEATLTKVRQLTESVNDTLWHNNTTGAPVTRVTDRLRPPKDSDHLV